LINEANGGSILRFPTTFWLSAILQRDACCAFGDAGTVVEFRSFIGRGTDPR